MADIGGFRRRIAEQAKQVAQQASQTGFQHMEQLAANRASSSASPDPDDGEAGASDADVAEEVSRLRAFLASHRPPPGPVQGRWSIGIGDLLAEHPRMPAVARGLVRNLDRYGGLAITERTIEIDHDAIEWSSVTEVRTRNVVDYLLSDALIQQINSLPLPWFPGRRRVLDALSKALLTLVITTAKDLLDRHADIRIPAEVEYRGTIRRSRQLAPGILAALVMADPAVGQCLQATARAHGISVRPADDDTLYTAGQRADQLRVKLGTLESQLGLNPVVATSSDVAEMNPIAATPTSSSVVSPTALRLPDQGDALIRLAGEVAGEWAAGVIAAEVASVRRPEGVLTFNDCRASKTFMKGPAHHLAAFLNLESIAVGVWASQPAGKMQRRTITKQVEQLCQQDGAMAGVQWALANGDRNRLSLDILRDSLAGVPQSMPGGEDFVRGELVRSLRKRR
jgi:hypothetical protein